MLRRLFAAAALTLGLIAPAAAQQTPAELAEGKPYELVKLEFASNDASALSEPNSRFTIYRAGTITGALTLNAGDQLIITDIAFRTNTTGMTIEVYEGLDNAPAAGEYITYRSALGATGNPAPEQLRIPHYCQPATGSDATGYPKVKAAAGAMNVIARGIIRRAN